MDQLIKGRGDIASWIGEQRGALSLSPWRSGAPAQSSILSWPATMDSYASCSTYLRALATRLKLRLL